QALALATELGDREEEVLRRDILIAEALGLGLCQLDGPAGTWIEGQRAALDPCPAGEDGRQLATECGQIDTEPAKGLGRDPVVRLDERGQDVFGVEDRAVEPLGYRLGGDDGLLGLLGEAIELHLTFSLGSGDGQSSLRGLGWSARRRNVRAASFASSDRFVGRTTRDLT